ncbi:MAG: hypothetical protein R2873_10850 [Caldilineaceae bacterium]|nr:hypothetical protein [Caldilineaceae bacterium]
MQAKRSVAVVVLVMIMIALLAGCGRRDTEEPIPTDTVVAVTNTPTALPPTHTPEPTETPTVESAPPAEEIDEAAAEDVQALLFNVPSDIVSTFRSGGALFLTTVFEDGATEEETLVLDGGYVRAANEFGFNQFFQLEAVRADQDELQSLAIYEVDEVVAALFNGSWRTADRNDAILSMTDNPFAPPLYQLTTSMSDADRIGPEERSGVEAIHYRSTDPALFLAAANLDLTDGQEIVDVQVDVWVAADGNYVLAYALQATINDAVDFDAERKQVRVDQEIDWQYEIYDIDGDVQIRVPEEAPEPSSANVPGFAVGEFPLPLGAEMKINMFGQTEITTELSETEVMNFYQQTLTELGWKIEGAFGLYEATKDELRFSMMALTTNQGKTLVQIRNE